MDKNLSKIRQKLIIVVIIIMISSFLSFYSFKLFRISVGIYSIVISFIMFIIILNTQQIISNNYYIFLGIAFGFIGFCEFIHCLTYLGLNKFMVFTPQVNSSIWFLSRFTLALSLLLSFLFIDKKVKVYKIVLGFLVYSLFCLSSLFYLNDIFFSKLPSLTINNLKLNNNYIIIFILLVTIYLLYNTKLNFNEIHYNNMVLAIFFFIISELFFLVPDTVGYFSKVFAHITKLLTFYFIYNSIVLTSLKEPYNTVFYRQTHANRKLNDLNHTLELVTQIHEIINSDFELDNLFEKIVNILIKKEDYQMAFIGKYLKENSRIRVKSSVGISSGFLKNKALDVNNENNAITQAVYRRKIIKDHNPQAVLNIFNKTDNNIHNSLIALPIYYNDTIYGVLAITSYKQDAFNKRVVELMKKTTQNLGLAITRYYTQKKIRYLSFHDQLTGLYNRNFFSEEIKRLDTSRKIPISIIVSDFNDLKYINDTYGHKVGDKFLKTYAEILQNNSRKEDIIARWGGDEFVILLPKTNQKITENLLDRIKESVSKVKIKGEELSIAWGYAIKDSEEQDIEEIFKKADEIMYENKKLIKNNNRENQI